MRVNIYWEELTREAVTIKKTIENGQTFYGARVFLATPTALHYNPNDDDRPAVTFWFKDLDKASAFVKTFRGQ